MLLEPDVPANLRAAIQKTLAELARAPAAVLPTMSVYCGHAPLLPYPMPAIAAAQAFE